MENFWLLRLKMLSLKKIYNIFENLYFKFNILDGIVYVW